MSCDMLIVGLPSAAGCPSTKTWRASAESVHSRLTARFGPAVSFEYADLFSAEMAAHPEVEAWVIAGEATPPIVVIDGVRRFSGGKLLISAIERAVAEVLGRQSVAPAQSPGPSPREHEEALHA